MFRRHPGIATLLTIACALLCGCAHTPRPAPFAHNDYQHPRPLFDALEHNFAGVEADVFLVNNQLFVGHEQKDLRPDRTLESLYLQPLRQHIASNGGRVDRRPAAFILMIDVKSDSAATYAALRDALLPHREILTTWLDGREHPRAVTVVLSGNRAKDIIAKESERLLAIDGRLEDLDGGAPASLIPWISADWSKTFTWRGEGEMPAAERQKLKDIVARAHAQGRIVRFWATPEKPAVWRELRSARVDLINTDDLEGLGGFLR
jgi:hypothetical protein